MSSTTKAKRSPNPSARSRTHINPRRFMGALVPTLAAMKASAAPVPQSLQTVPVVQTHDQTSKVSSSPPLFPLAPSPSHQMNVVGRSAAAHGLVNGYSSGAQPAHITVTKSTGGTNTAVRRDLPQAKHHHKRSYASDNYGQIVYYALNGASILALAGSSLLQGKMLGQVRRDVDRLSSPPASYGNQ